MLFPADLDNDDKPKRLMEANVNMVQVSVALNQGMISSYHLVHSRVWQIGQKCVFMCVDTGSGVWNEEEGSGTEGNTKDLQIISSAEM